MESTAVTDLLLLLRHLNHIIDNRCQPHAVLFLFLFFWNFTMCSFEQRCKKLGGTSCNSHRNEIIYDHKHRGSKFLWNSAVEIKNTALRAKSQVFCLWIVFVILSALFLFMCCFKIISRSFSELHYSNLAAI